MKLYPYNQGSASAKALSEALGIKRIKHDGKPLNLRGAAIINWGASGLKRELKNVGKIFNPPEAIRKASNKLTTLTILKEAGVSVPEFTTDVGEALLWVRDGQTAVARTVLNGHSGEGIELLPNGDPDWHPEVDWVEAPLYTKYVKKVDEFRIHVFQGKVIFQQRKARKKDVPDEEVNWKIRNHGNGFIFAHQGVDVALGGVNAAVAAVQALGLDFGAVDLIRTKDNQFYVLEVNTACGMEGETLNRYKEAFENV